MKTKLLFTLLFISLISFGQDLSKLPLYEGFDYSEGTTLLDSDNKTGQGSWIEDNYGSTKNPFVIASPFASYTGLPEFTGNAIEIKGGTNDPLLYFEPVSEDDGVSLYASCMIKVTDMSALSGTAKDYFFTLSTSGTGGYGAALYFSQIDATTYNLGINESNTSGEAIIHTSTTFTENVDEIFVVIKYEFNKEGNSVAHLFINPTINGATEPSATIDTSSLALVDEANKSTFTALKINANSNAKTPGIAIDEIRIGTSWEEVVTTTTLGVNQNVIANFNVYPNPANGFINIDSKNEKIVSVDVINVLGKIVISKKDSSINQLNMSNLSEGVYFMKIKSDKNNIMTKRLIIN
jgi:hypothetical protein